MIILCWALNFENLALKAFLAPEMRNLVRFLKFEFQNLYYRIDTYFWLMREQMRPFLLPKYWFQSHHNNIVALFSDELLTSIVGLFPKL